jgi:membrane-associated protein
MFELIKHILDPLFLIQTLGLFGIFAIIFAETGLFFGFFLPGDSLLFVGGVLASQNILSIWTLALGVFLMAVIGDTVGYSFGYRVGRKFFQHEESTFFKKKYLIQTEQFFAKYGPKAVVLARFVPIVRTFTPILAGIGKMSYRTFISYNIVGGFLWSFILIFLGFFFGQLIPNAEKYILPIVIVIIIVSFIPAVRELWKNHKREL